MDKISQKENYSGKKKKHTSKILIISSENKYIHGITPVYVGKEHDFSILKEEKLEELLPLETPIYIDNGFQGLEKIAPNLNIKKPKKKKKFKELNGGEKLGNRIISRERVKVEHAIGGFKRFKIASTIFRGINKPMIKAIEIACGLWNFHIRKMGEIMDRTVTCAES